MLIVARAVLAIGVSIAALLISLALDRIFAPLSAIPQFLIQIPILVLTMDYLRTLTIHHATGLLGADAVNGAFFFAAPLAAVASSNLIQEIRSLF
jgi:hypothetical protein